MSKPHPPCHCSRCVPNDIPKDPRRCACSRCGEEVRFGEREGKRGWWHRGPVDHMPVLGHSVPAAVSNMLEAEEEQAAADEEEGRMGPPEVPAHPVDLADFAAQSGLRQIGNLVSGVTKAGKKKSDPPAAPGWELVNITHARGHYMGSKGGSLGISDTHVLRARGPVGLDGSRRVAVASWRDLKFDFAFVGAIMGGKLTSTRKVSSTEMKDWIKGHDVSDPLQQPGE